MELSKEIKNSMVLSSNIGIINEEIFKKLIQNCFSVLCGKPEICNITTLYNSKPDLIKQIYAAFLTVAAEFARHDFNKENVIQYLTNELNYNTNRASYFSTLYERNKAEIQVSLGNVGSHLPHITDVNWKIDYIVTSSNLDQASGPLFRISLITNVFDEETTSTKVERVNFTCNSQELQDLVYKLKDAVRHCHKLTGEH